MYHMICLLCFSAFYGKDFCIEGKESLFATELRNYRDGGTALLRVLLGKMNIFIYQLLKFSI